MTTDITTIPAGARIETTDGETGIFLSAERGWATVELDDGTQRKLRGKQFVVTDEGNTDEEAEGNEAEEAEGNEAEEAEGNTDEGNTDEEAEAEEGTDEGNTDEEAETPAFNGERLRARKAQYVGHRHCGDEVAVALANVALPDLLNLTKELELYNPKWESLNPGQQRMNAGNRIRAMVRKLRAKDGGSGVRSSSDEERGDNILARLQALPTKPREFHVVRNGRPVKRCATQAECEAIIAEASQKGDPNAVWTFRQI